MNRDVIRDRFEPWRQQHRRAAFRPRTRTVGPTTPSRFGGDPTVCVGQPWPACANCGHPMRFFAQFEVSELPAPLTWAERGLLQLFSCSQDDGSCETWRPFSGANLVRLQTEATFDAVPPAPIEAFPARYIEGWTDLLDFPSPSEHSELGLGYVYDFVTSVVTVRCPALHLELQRVPLALNPAEAIASAAPQDKLGGWPHWVQGVEYPHCPRCDTRMAYLVQIDSEDNVPFAFGDNGCGHITYCPVHRDVLAFGWACG